MYTSDSTENRNHHNSSTTDDDDAKQNIHDIVLRVENRSKIFDSAAGKVVALGQINFTVSKGEFVSVIGPSVSGKSTLLNMVGALDRQDYHQWLLSGESKNSIHVWQKESL